MTTRGSGVENNNETPTHTTASRSSTTSDNSPSKRWPAPNPRFPMIVELDDELVAIACGICKANSIAGNPRNPPSKFFNGMRGLQSHMVRGHGAKGITMDEVAAQCYRTALSASDARLLRSGRMPLMKIEMVTRAESSTAEDAPEIAAAAGLEMGEGHKKTTKELHAAYVLNATNDPLWPSLHSNYPMIVRIAGTGFAIACHICGANAKAPFSGSPDALFMAGVNGLLHHVGRCHPESGKMNRQAIVDQCQRTRISAADVRRIQMGQAPSAQINMVKFQRINQGRDAAVEEVEDENVVDSDSSLALSPTTGNNAASHMDSINDDFPTVIYGDETWESISCHLCGANARRYKSVHMRYLRGIFGLAAHYRQAHPRDESWSSAEVYGSCTREPIDPGFVNDILAGRQIEFPANMDLGSDLMQSEEEDSAKEPDEQETSRKTQVAGSIYSDDRADFGNVMDYYEDVGDENDGHAVQSPRPQGRQVMRTSTPPDSLSQGAQATSQNRLLAGALSLWKRKTSSNTDGRPGSQRASLPAVLGKRAASPDADEGSSSDSDRPLKQRKTSKSRMNAGSGASRKRF